MDNATPCPLDAANRKLGLYFRLAIGPFMVLWCLSLTGCSGCNRALEPAKQQRKKEEPLALARELYRTATEAAQFRDANERINSYLASQPDALARHQSGPTDFLESFVGLDKSESDEVESNTFKLMDGYYLEECFLLREVTRSMPLQGLSPLEQARFCFSWVMRRVLLQEGPDELLPPQFVLRRGQGSAAERAVVFMALLQQATPAPDVTAPHLDGCVICLPGKSGQPRVWLAGVLITDNSQSDVYLFEPHLGLPVPGPDGKGIATLAQLRTNPSLLDAFKVPGEVCRYDVEATEVAKAEILLTCPLSGLSARMRYLQDELLFGFDRINVAIRATTLLEHFKKLNAGTVRIWPAATRALRQFLPPEEGGTDKSHRLELFYRRLLPASAILQGFADLKLARPDLRVSDAEQRLEALTQQLWLSYIFTPSQELLRGRLEDCVKRMVRIQKVVDDVRGNAIEEAEVAKWRQRVRDAYAKNDGATINQIWSEDQWLRQLVSEPDDEPANPRQTPKKLLSDLVLGAVSEPFHLQCEYLLALRWHELAERLQVQTTLKAASNAERSTKAKQDARSAWTNANSWWSGFGHDNPLSVDAWQARMAAVKTHLKSNRHPSPAGLLDYDAKLLREAAAARLLRVEALEALGEQDAAQIILKQLVADLTALEKAVALDRPRWQPFINAAAGPLRDTLAASLNGVTADFAPNGSLYWMRYTAILKMAKS